MRLMAISTMTFLIFSACSFKSELNSILGIKAPDEEEKPSCLSHGQEVSYAGVPTKEALDSMPTCCPGTVQGDYGVHYDLFSKQCLLLVGGYGRLCLKCGDGKCDSEFENPCNCEADCGKPKSR